MADSYLRHNAEVDQSTPKTETVLRRITCGYCRAVFTVCTECYRGQRYCRQSCRKSARLDQRRAADRRYQGSERGKLAHRHRQREYRSRRAQPCVTDQARQTVTIPVVLHPGTACHCSICGRFSPWVNPFPPIPRRR